VAYAGDTPVELAYFNSAACIREEWLQSKATVKISSLGAEEALSLNAVELQNRAAKLRAKLT